MAEIVLEFHRQACRLLARFEIENGSGLGWKAALPPRPVTGEAVVVHMLSVAAPCTLATRLLSQRT